MTSMTMRPLLGPSTPDAKPAAVKTSPKSLWVGMATTCLLLGISAGFRFWREWQFHALANASATCPFPLKDLPERLGTWHRVEGSESQLEPEVALTAGSSDHIICEYVDEKNGERVSALVLYGLAETVFAHTPDSCYPGQGYRAVVEPEDRRVVIPGMKTPVQCRAAVYAKKDGSVIRYEEVYYTFFHNREWIPDLESRWKSFRYHPSTFKIQLQRRVSAIGFEDSSSEALLGVLAQYIDERTKANPDGGTTNTRAPAQVPPPTTPVPSDARPS
jgi:hypothetical protein